MVSLFEILVLATLAGYLFFRLWSILGEKRGVERPSMPEFLDTAAPTKEAEKLNSLSEKDEETLRNIQQKDPDFVLDDFLNGAKSAFEIIVNAFSKGDLEALNGLLRSKIYTDFEKSIQERLARQENLETTIRSIDSAELNEMILENDEVWITVKFITTQVSITRNKDGQIIDNPAGLQVTMVDIWKFYRNLSDSDSNWLLSSVKAG